MGFINKEQMERRLSDGVNLVSRASRIDPKTNVDSSEVIEIPKAPFDDSKFKNDGTARKGKRFSSELRAAIATTTLLQGAASAAEQFDCSSGTAGKFSRGQASEGIDLVERESKNEKLRTDIYDNLSEVRERAKDKLFKILNLIDDPAINSVPDKDKLRVYATTANQLAGVIDKTIEKGKNLIDGRSAHLHLYSPEQQEVASYKVTKVGATPELNTPNTIDVTPK